MSDELSEEDLEAVCGAKLEADKVDISIVLDDTMIKGVEPGRGTASGQSTIGLWPMPCRSS